MFILFNSPLWMQKMERRPLLQNWTLYAHITNLACLICEKQVKHKCVWVKYTNIIRMCIYSCFFVFWRWTYLIPISMSTFHIEKNTSAQGQELLQQSIFFFGIIMQKGSILWLNQLVNSTNHRTSVYIGNSQHYPILADSKKSNQCFISKCLNAPRKNHAIKKLHLESKSPGFIVCSSNTFYSQQNTRFWILSISYLPNKGMHLPFSFSFFFFKYEIFQ